MDPLRVLVIEDSSADAEISVRALQRRGRVIEFKRVDSAATLSDALDGARWDVILCDWSLPGFSALAALALLRERKIDLPFIIVSGTIAEDAGVEAMRAGAHDYVLKEKLDRLGPAVERELGEHRNRRTLVALAEQLRQSQKMDAMGRLAGGVAHDFNNLLSVIISYSDMLLSDLGSQEPMREDVEQIRRAGLRAAELTRQLLQFSRQQVTAPRVVELNGLLTGLDKMLRRIVGEDVALAFVPAATVGRVRVDPGSIEQVIMNLVVNARDAMPTGGKLTVETANVVLDENYVAQHLAAKPGPYVMFSVSDTGVGMDKATADRIFDPFFTTKEKGKGTGLGLSTVFGIVQQSEGTLWVYSEPGVGTTFKVYLPRVDATVEEAAPAVNPTTRRGTETILLTEDEDQVRDACSSLLRRHGYTVLEARNAGEALLICERQPSRIHLLLTDVVMPQMSGPELAKRLAPTQPTMKVLCMSGYTEDAAVRHGVIAAEFAYLQKPITSDVLTKRVREVLDSP